MKLKDRLKEIMHFGSSIVASKRAKAIGGQMNVKAN